MFQCERIKSMSSDDVVWGRSSEIFCDSARRDLPPSPIRKPWKSHSPRRNSLHSFQRFQSPKRSVFSGFPNIKDKKPNSPMSDIIQNLNTLINSPDGGRFQRSSPSLNFPKTPGNRKMFSSYGSTTQNPFFGNLGKDYFPTVPNRDFVGKDIPCMIPNGERFQVGSNRDDYFINSKRNFPFANNGGAARCSPNNDDNGFGEQIKQKHKPVQVHPYLTWSGKLPPKDVNDNKYSRKVFLGGVPWDITDEDLDNTFSRFGSLSVEWPPIKNGQKPKGYVYIVFDESASVNTLLDYCRSYSARVFRDVSDGTMYKYHVQSEKMKSKEIQVIPWNLNDSTKVIGPQDKVNMHHQVFVGGLHGMLTANGLAKVMNDLFGNVVYVEVDTDKYKYPLGSGRVNFSSMESFKNAIQGKYVQVKCNSPKIDKRIQIDPYIRENENCSKCKEYPGPLYCRSCFEYLCESCWDYHMRHAPVKHESVSRTRNGKTNN